MQGLVCNVAAVTALWDASKTDILILKETWQKPEEASPLEIPKPRANPPRVGTQGRCRGGVTELLRPGVRSRLLNRIARQHHQEVVVQVGSITVIGAYLAPG